MTDSLIHMNILTKAQDSPHASLSNTSKFCSKLIIFLAHLATFSTFLTLHMLRGHKLTQWIITLMMSAIKIEHKRMNSRKHMLNLHTEKETWKCMLHSRLNISEQWTAVNNTLHWGWEEALVNCTYVYLFCCSWQYMVTKRSAHLWNLRLQKISISNTADFVNGFVWK
jgi:hypothetical protein